MALYSIGAPIITPVAYSQGSVLLVDGAIKQPPNTYPTISPTIFTGSIYPLTMDVTTPVFDGPALLHLSGDKVTTSLRNRALAFGVVTTDTVIQITVTNYTTDTLTVSEINHHPFSISGIVVTGLIVTDTIAPNSSVTFDVTAFASTGIASVDSDFQLVFSSGLKVSYDLRIVRASSFCYSLEPDASTYSERITYKTEVIEFTNGREARNSLLEVPKGSVDYTTTVTSAALLDYGTNVVHLGFRNSVHQPLWSQMHKYGSGFSGSVIYFDTVGKDYKVGGYVAFLDNPLYPVVIRITAVTDTYLALENNITMDGAFIITPTFEVLPSSSTSYASENLRFGKFNFKLQEK